MADSNASADELKAKTEAVQQASMELGQKVYEAAQAQQQAGSQSAGSTSQENTSSSSGDNGADDAVDADFEEVK